MRSFEELMLKAKDLSKAELEREISATAQADARLKERCMSEILRDVRRFKTEYLEKADTYKGHKVRLNFVYFRYDRKENVNPYLNFWLFFLPFLAEYLEESFRDKAEIAITKTNAESSVYDEIELYFY